MRMTFGVVVLAIATLLPLGAQADLAVDNVLPAGNIVYERTEGDTVYVHQELRDTARVIRAFWSGFRR